MITIQYCLSSSDPIYVCIYSNVSTRLYASSHSITCFKWPHPLPPSLPFSCILSDTSIYPFLPHLRFLIHEKMCISQIDRIEMQKAFSRFSCFIFSPLAHTHVFSPTTLFHHLIPITSDINVVVVFSLLWTSKFALLQTRFIFVYVIRKKRSKTKGYKGRKQKSVGEWERSWE